MRSAFTPLLILVTFFISGCDPDFQSTAQRCETRLGTTQVTDSYSVEADQPNSNYKLYLEDFLNSIAPLRSDDTLSDDESAVIDFIYAQVDSYLGYQFDDQNKVASANNPIDFIEALFSTTDPDEKVFTFSKARETLFDAIASDDAICNYQNDQIVFQLEEEGSSSPVSKTFTSLDLSYIPTSFVEESDLKVDQFFSLQLDDDYDNDETESKIFYNSLVRYQPPERFQKEGFVQPNTRRLDLSIEGSFQNFVFNDNFITEALDSLLQITEINEYCVDDSGRAADCPDGANIRTPEHPYCQGELQLNDQGETVLVNVVVEDVNGREVEFAEEVNQVITNDFSIPGASEDFQNLKRFRVELDYDPASDNANTLRIYISKFNSAIVKALDEASQQNPSDDDLLFNSTSCESTAVSLQRYKQIVEDGLTEEEAERFEDGIPATVYRDPGFDEVYTLDKFGQVITDEEGDPVSITQPTPIMTFALDSVVSREAVDQVVSDD